MAEATLTPYLECGRVINTHGCRGGIKVEPWADSPMDLCRLGHLFLRRGADMLGWTLDELMEQTIAAMQASPAANGN